VIADERWLDPWAALGVAASDRLAALQADVLARYREPQRHYHTMQHIDECFERWQELRAHATHPAEVQLALWFHDVIYDTQRSDNEARSAALARDAALSLGVVADAAQRILVLGDSFTWGWGVSQGEALTDRLQARLAPTVAIYNRGVIGFGTAQEYLLLKRELAANTYEAVVLMFFINDLNDNGDGKDGHRPYFELVDGQLLPRNQPALARTSPLQLFLKDHSRAYLFVEFELGMLKRRFRGETDDERLYREKAAVDFHDLPGYAVTARLLEEMNRLVREHGARFFLVYVPQRGESDLDAPHPYVRSVHAMIDDITRRAGIPMIDLAPVFRQQVKAGHELVYPIDAHWNRTGHALAADVLLSSPIFASYDGAAGRDARRRGAVASTDASTVRR